ncbi:MAG: MlaD family protein [Myxococcota bacterium]
MEADRRTYLRVGLFVTAAMTIGAILIFVIGSRSRVFQPKNTYFAVFEDVDGLREGSPVRVAGVSVGSVADVEFTEGGHVRARFTIVEQATEYLREGSYATVASKGMLGDKLVEVTVGDGAPLPPETTIPSEEPAGLADYMQSAGRILANVEATANNLRRASEPLGEPEFAESVRQASRNVAEVTRMAAEGEGVVHRLLADPKLGRDVGRMVDQMRVASGDLARTSRGVRAIVEEVESGDGTAHDLVYGEGGKIMVRNFADAAGEVATLLQAVREGEGTLHDLIYEDSGNELLANLEAASGDIRAITGAVRDGKGTLGALIQDPSVYEDVKRLVGDLERNEILRSLVRYSIKRDEQGEAAEVESHR